MLSAARVAAKNFVLVISWNFREIFNSVFCKIFPEFCKVSRRTKPMRSEIPLLYIQWYNAVDYCTLRKWDILAFSSVYKLVPLWISFCGSPYVDFLQLRSELLWTVHIAVVDSCRLSSEPLGRVNSAVVDLSQLSGELLCRAPCTIT